MTTLVFGANGLLGSNVLDAASSRGNDPVGSFHSTEPALDVPTYRTDIRDTGTVDALLDECEPDVVINCAAMTDVDACERSPERAMSVNAEAPGRIARSCSQRGIRFVHVSTDYVFSGETDEPYGEGATPDPIQVYGETKLAGERAVRENHQSATIVRLSFVYGVHRGAHELRGFPAWVRDSLLAGNSLSLFTDQRVSPTRAGQAASTIYDLEEAGHTGLYHLVSRSCVTPYEFGESIRERTGVSADLIRKSRLSDVDRAAPRPSYTCLDPTTLETDLGRPQPTLSEDLTGIEPSFSERRVD